MQIPRWKKYLSYLFELPLETAASEHNPYLEVTLKKGRFQLSTANAVYSFGDLYDNFSSAFAKLNLEQLPIEKVLVLGFGLGSIPIVMEKMYGRSYHFTAVEIDETVLALANKYALPDIQSPIEMICADAHAFVMQCSEQFDLITVDVFVDDKVPAAFEATAFLQQLQQLLRPSGVLLYNRLAYTQQDTAEAKAFYESSFHPNFPKGTYIPVRGNWILLNDRQYLNPA
ncbi:MAG: methyltransferase domain-containing protein [Bacteroidota bacterium]